MSSQQRISIVGGMSFPGRIAIASERFQSIATWRRVDGKETIETVVKPVKLLTLHGAGAGWWFFVPRVIRLYLFLFISGNWIVRLLLVASLYELFRPVAPTRIDYVTALPMETVLLIDLAWLLFIIWFVSILIRTRPWHGAEHMAIAAYLASRGARPTARDIEAQSPVHPRCGGRLVPPILLLTFIMSWIAVAFHIPSTWVFVLGLEAILWTDELIGFSRIPFFAQLASGLQRYVTTKKPTHREIRTAKAAMDALLRAHEKAAR